MPSGKYKGIYHCGSTVIKEEGVRSLWKGLTPFATHLTLKYALRMGSNSVYQNIFRSKVCHSLEHDKDRGALFLLKHCNFCMRRWQLVATVEVETTIDKEGGHFIPSSGIHSIALQMLFSQYPVTLVLHSWMGLMNTSVCSIARDMHIHPHIHTWCGCRMEASGPLAAWQLVSWLALRRLL